MEINGPIERIPPPAKRRGRPAIYKVEDLLVGDSRFIAAPPQKVRPALNLRAKALGWVLQTKAEGDGTRVWRIA